MSYRDYETTKQNYVSEGSRFIHHFSDWYFLKQRYETPRKEWPYMQQDAPVTHP